jgi:hypothetical protein
MFNLQINRTELGLKSSQIQHIKKTSNVPSTNFLKVLFVRPPRGKIKVAIMNLSAKLAQKEVSIFDEGEVFSRICFGFVLGEQGTLFRGPGEVMRSKKREKFQVNFSKLR